MRVLLHPEMFLQCVYALFCLVQKEKFPPRGKIFCEQLMDAPLTVLKVVKRMANEDKIKLMFGCWQIAMKELLLQVQFERLIAH